ncbi:hypothetical protein FKM82_023051 [Ascaphus truei]
MVRTKADSAGSSGSYRKAVAARAPRKAFGSSSSTSNPATSPSGNPLEENCVPSDGEAGGSGLGKAWRKTCPLPPDPSEDDAAASDEE